MRATAGRSGPTSGVSRRVGRAPNATPPTLAGGRAVGGDRAFVLERPLCGRCYNPSIAAQINRFEFEGHSLAYAEHGAGPRAVVLLPGLLFNHRMHEPV